MHLFVLSLILFYGVKSMEILKYGAIALLIIGALAVLVCAVKGGKPLKSLLLNAFLGIAVMAVIDLTSKFTGVHVPVNQWTVAGAAGFGVTAVCTFLVLPIIFK